MSTWADELVENDAEAIQAPAPGRLDVAAAALAALAESGPFYLVTSLVVVEGLRGTTGPLLTLPVFLPMFTAAVVAATLGRAWRPMPVVAALAALAVGVGQAVEAGPRNATGLIIAVLVALGLALRVVTLALRNWRDPVRGSFASGAALLLLEILFAKSAGWEGTLPLVVPLFLLCSLASRAVTMWPGGGADGREGGAEWGRLTVVVLLGVAGSMALAVVLGARGGLLQGAGQFVIPLAGVLGVIAFFAATEPGGDRPKRPGGTWGMAAGLGLLLLLVLLLALFHHPAHRIHPVPVPVQLGRHRFGNDAAERLLGLLILAALGLVLVRAILRRWKLPQWWEGEALPVPDGQTGTVGGPPRASGHRRPHRRLPAETVRRWYAEALLILEERDLPKPPARTPREFAPQVAAAFPGCADEFGTLTLAYHEVRYGNVRVEPEVFAGLKRAHDGLIRQLRTAPRADHPETEPEEDADDQSEA